MKTEKSQMELKPYSISELGRIYGVDPRTLKKWLKPFQREIGERNGRFFRIPQVKVIFEKLGYPTIVNC